MSGLIVRILIVTLALGAWFLTQKLIGSRAPVKDGIGDQFHWLTREWNRKLAANPRAARLLLILSSLGIDLLGVTLLALAIFGPTIEPFIGLFIVFVLRQLNQAFTALPVPEGMIWTHPGFPSLLVTYGVTNDLFFSGHTAIAVLGAYYFFHSGSVLLGALGIGLALFEALAVLVLRAHWTADVFTGAVTALWAGQLASMLAPSIDTALRSLSL